MNILLCLKLTTELNMRYDVLCLRDVVYVHKLHVLTDHRCCTEVDNVIYHYLPRIISKIPVIRVLWRLPYMIAICKKNNITLLVCYHLTSYGLIGLVVSKILRIPISMHFLGKDLGVLCRNAIFGKLFLGIASKMDRLTVQGKNSQRFLFQNGITNVSIVPTVCDIDLMGSVELVDKVYDLIFVGRLSSEKRVDRFVDIVRIIVDKGFAIKAVILGTGPCERELKKQIAKYDLEANIDFMGWVDRVDMYLHKSKIFVLTSDNDQLPRALLEAMACGLVPVVGNVGDVSDVVHDDNGYLLEKENINDFAEAAIELLNNEKLYNRKSDVNKKIASEFTVKTNIVRWEVVIQKIMGKSFNLSGYY